jgi:antitoxin HicB
MQKRTFQLAFESDPEGGYTVTVPALPGCVTYGATLEEARAMAREAIELYLEDLAAHQEKIPENDSTLWGTIEVAVSAQ